jgi:ligand-binding SRPBCC domain-containing protein
MADIFIKTFIAAPRERCFLLSCSIDLHKLSTTGSHEQAVAGITSGLIGDGETVTWRARHFGMYFTMTTLVCNYKFPDYFESRMIKGPFKKIIHRHVFIKVPGGTEMQDHFHFEAPFGLFGKLVSRYILKKHMTDLLIQRNAVIKSVAESEEWKKYT